MARKKNSSKNAAAGSKQLENACSSNPIPLIESESHTPSDDSNDFQHPLGEKWTLKDIFSIAQLQSDVPPKCHDTDCVHVACAQWLSSTTGETWNLCIDCNRKKFGGWPKNLDEYPITFVTEEHRRIMCQLCSNKTNSDTPLLPLSENGSLSQLHEWKERNTFPTDTVEKHEDTLCETSSPKDASNNESEVQPKNEEKNEDEVSSPAKVSPSDTGEEEPVEQWEIKHIFTVEELLQNDAQKCGSKKCPLVACSIWISSENEEWNGCLDCQQDYYDRWPENASEYPISFMTVDHRELIWEKCTGRYKPDMPQLPLTDGGSMDDLYKWEKSHGIGKFRDDAETEYSNPIAKEMEDSDRLQHRGTIEDTRTPPPSFVDKAAKEIDNSWVTPSPMPPASKNTVANGKLEKNKHHLQLHEKWQKEADKMGGGRIIVNKDEAKSVIFMFLRDQFRPMNITEIYTGLKAVVPNQMVKMCLDDMALDHFIKESQFIESDEEDDDSERQTVKNVTQNKTSIPNDIYAGSLCLKKGRNANTSLYYVDQKKLINNGDGLLPEDRNELYSNHANALAEKASIQHTTMVHISEANKLLSQLTNIEMNSKLTALDYEVTELRSKIDSAIVFKDNEKSRKLLLKKIDIMQAQWRKRKRLCMDFLCMMEEVTEGSVSMKKSLEGDGPIELESDEAAIKSSIAFNTNKRKRQSNLGRSHSGDEKRHKSEYVVSESFVGVELTSLGIKRVFLNE